MANYISSNTGAVIDASIDNYKNYNDKDQLMIVGGAEQNGHDYGWQFGNWQLRGYEGINEDLK